MCGLADFALQLNEPGDQPVVLAACEVGLRARAQVRQVARLGGARAALVTKLAVEPHVHWTSEGDDDDGGRSDGGGGDDSVGDGRGGDDDGGRAEGEGGDDNVGDCTRPATHLMFSQPVKLAFASAAPPSSGRGSRTMESRACLEQTSRHPVQQCEEPLPETLHHGGDGKVVDLDHRNLRGINDLPGRPARRRMRQQYMMASGRSLPTSSPGRPMET